MIGASTSDAGHPRYAVITPVSGFTKLALTDWAQRHLQPETDVYSDGLGAFRAVVDLGHAHTVLETAGGCAATEATDARWVNIVLSNLKRSLDGAYHSFGFFKYAIAIWPRPPDGSIVASSWLPWCRACWWRPHAGPRGRNAGCVVFLSTLVELRR